MHKGLVYLLTATNVIIYFMNFKNAIAVPIAKYGMVGDNRIS